LGLILAEIKTRRIKESDWKKLETHVSDELSARSTSQFRKNHEEKWKEVDRQIAMNPLRKGVAGQTQSPDEAWQSAFELGELSKASEIIADDAMRITFPDENWFEPHVELQRGADQKPVPQKKQVMADGLLRSLMTQQHKDFGFKGRFRLSVKEALHHGGFVAEAKFAHEMMVFDGQKLKPVSSPVWQPISMWNAYPDPSPSVIGTNLFYTGSMIINEFMPLWRLKQIAKGDGWMPARLSKISQDEHDNGEIKTKDVKLTKFYGDLNIERSDGDIYFPNSFAILANGVIVFMKANELPYPSIIYGGYERQDIRDPYYTSPIIKQSPMQKITTIIANRFIDSVELKTRPPIEYDGNDPDYVVNDGPAIYPGAKTPTKSIGKGMTVLDIGVPRWGLEGLQMGLRQMQEGTGVSSLRTGVTNSDRQTATEVNKTQQGAEVRTVAFVGMLEEGGLRPWLYMQHELNRLNMKEYTFYNSEMNTPDFIRATKKDIQANAHFDVVGSRGLLGEEQRTQRVGAATAFFSGNPLFAPKLKTTEIMLQTYRDAGLKSPEQFVEAEEQGPQIPPEVQAQMQQMQQMVRQLQEELQKAQSGVQAQMAKIQLEQEKAKADHALKAAGVEIARANSAADQNIDKRELMLQMQKDRAELELERQNMDREHALKMESIRLDFEAKMEQIRLNSEIQGKKLEEAQKVKRKKISIKRGASGDIEGAEVDE